MRPNAGTAADGRRGGTVAEGPPLIRLTDVSKRYDTGLEAVRGVSLRVGAGEFVSLLGASGCGKSTVLRLAAGLESASSGTVDLTHAAAGDVAFVFQEPALMPWASVFDNVWLPLRLAGQRRAAAAVRVQEALATVGLSAFAEAYPAQLSGGMKMRASIARALVTRPQVLLMDEPFAALDDLTRGRLNADLLAWWAAQRLAALFVTHNIAEAVFLSSRVLVMAPRPGRVVAEHVIDEPYPRLPSFRSSPRYVEHCRLLAVALEAAHEAAVAAAAPGARGP